MDINTFLVATYNVHSSKHGDNFIYVGHDPSKRWSAFFNGEDKELDLVETLEDAESAAHRLYDAGKPCGLKLEWKLVPETEVKDLEK